MLIATFVIKGRLKMAGRTYLGKSGRWSSLKGRSLIHRFKNRSSWHKRGLEGSTVRGRTKWGGVTSPTLPQTASTPACTQSTTVSVIKSQNCSQTLALSSRMGGGSGESYEEPLKFPLKCLKSRSILTPSLIISIRST